MALLDGSMRGVAKEGKPSSADSISGPSSADEQVDCSLEEG